MSLSSGDITMKKWIFAAIAACGLCCIPLLIPAAAGLSIFGLQMFGGPWSIETILCSLAPAVLVVLLVAVMLKLWTRRQKAAATCKSDACEASGSCGCK